MSGKVRLIQIFFDLALIVIQLRIINHYIFCHDDLVHCTQVSKHLSGGVNVEVYKMWVFNKLVYTLSLTLLHIICKTCCVLVDLTHFDFPCTTIK